MCSLFKYIFRLILFVAIFWAVGLLYFAASLPQAQTSKDSGEKADAIIVLTGGSLRLEQGFKLLADNRSEILFISGVEDGISVTQLLHTKEYDEFIGKFAPEKVILGYQARSTRGNGEEIGEFVRSKHIKSMILVTANYHMQRSLHEIARNLPDVNIIAYPVFPAYFKDANWWRFPEAWRLLISEYHKYIASFLI